MEDRFKKLYLSLLENGDLRNLSIPKMKGNWEEDRELFIYFQKELEKVANIKDVDFE